MTAEEYSPILNFSNWNRERMEKVWKSVARQQAFTRVLRLLHINNHLQLLVPIGFNTQVTGQIAFTRIPRVDENTLPVNFLTKGYSYTGLRNYSLPEPNEIAGFTKNFSTTQYSSDNITNIPSGLGVNENTLPV